MEVRFAIAANYTAFARSSHCVVCCLVAVLGACALLRVWLAALLSACVWMHAWLVAGANAAHTGAKATARRYTALQAALPAPDHLYTIYPPPSPHIAGCACCMAHRRPSQTTVPGLASLLTLPRHYSYSSHNIDLTCCLRRRPSWAAAPVTLPAEMTTGAILTHMHRESKRYIIYFMRRRRSWATAPSRTARRAWPALTTTPATRASRPP